MFKEFFLSELKYSLKQPMVYIFLGLIGLLTFGGTASDSVIIGGSVGNVYRNAPHIITTYVLILNIFGLLIAAAFFNNAALRGHNNNFNEILFSTPLQKRGYFFGKFFGALILATIPMLGVFLGSILGTALAPVFGWIDAERFGSFYLETFINNYFLFVLPNMFFAGTIIFALANKWRSTVISFIGALVIIISYIISGNLLSDIDNETIAALSDTFGIRAYSVYTKYFTPIEKNTLSPAFTGLLLYNRLIWIGAGLVVIIISYFSFSFTEKGGKVKKVKASKKETDRVFSLPNLNPSYLGSTEWQHFKSFFVINFLSIVKSVTFRILFLFCAIILIANLIGGYEYFGLKMYPLTYKLSDTITGLSGTFVIIILVFYSGELVWRDRESNINEVIDSTPHTSLVSLSSKVLSLILATSILHVFLIICGVLYQVMNGFFRIELDVYFLDFFYSNFALYIILSGIMIMIHVVINNKYIGYFVSILIIFIWDIILSVFDIQSNMLSIGGSPSFTYSDINAFGPSINGVLWFNLYWILFSLICLLIAGALWQRGSALSLKKRILAARKQTPKSYRLIIIGTISSWVLVASFVYYNTQVLNEYRTSDEREELSADYEKKYKKYENAIMPKAEDIKFIIDIYPYKRDVITKATMTLVNHSEKNIDSIIYNINTGWETEILIPNSEIVYNDEVLDFRIYKLSKPMEPDERINIEINTKYITKGFENSRGNTSIVNNGTFLNNMQVMPGMGYNASVELSDKNTRKKYGLKPKDRMPDLQADCTENCMKNYLTGGASDFINVETVISTSADQIAIAPGSLIKKWEENGRNYFHYKVDHPSQNFYSFISAKFEVQTKNWNGIDIEVYYDSKHSKNVPMMIDAVQRSLEYYTNNFGPYMHRQCRIIEFPRYSTFAQAFPGTMPYSESIGFVINLEDEDENNVVDAVIAHEMGHQWWAHQVIGAFMQGATMFSEGFSEYSSLMVMKSTSKTPMKMREFIKYDHDRYLGGRSGETEKELPLYKVENQTYIHYGKGSVILYALQDYIGEEKVNRALRNFLDEFKYKNPPYPTSLDFMKYLEPEVPDSLQYLINDWFKEITLYDNRLKEVSYSKMDNGKYQVNIDIESKKMRSDSIGNETEIEINDWVDIGAFSDSDEENLIFEKRVKINRNEMTFVIELDTIPAKVAIDPRHLLIDRVYKDNIKSVN